MRADRLIALLLMLQRHNLVTAAEVAQELEVSERTARRDLEALAMSGVPIYSTPGRGGGWRLLGGARTDLTGLSADEARALFLAAGPALDSTPELKSAMRKLSGALPETFRADAEAASMAIKVDSKGWGQISSNQPEHLDTLVDATVSARQVELEYVTPNKGASTRIISPLGLVTKRGIWYLIANTAKGLRTFRVGRVRSASVLDGTADRPKDFDLEAAWERIVGEVETRMSGISVDLIADDDMLRPLQHQFRGRLVRGDSVGDGRTRITVTESVPVALAAQLAGYGASVDVLNPSPELETEFTRITDELTKRWRPHSSIVQTRDR